MLVRLKGGTVYDPAHGVDGKARDIYIRDGVFTKDAGGRDQAQEYDLSGKVVMAGAIDMHSHIAGGKLNIARMMLPELNRRRLYPSGRGLRAGAGEAAISSFATGYRYAEMGFTAAFEPAMMPSNARQTHLELDDIPILDKGAYVMLGNDDYLLRCMAGKTPQAAINDYVAWTVEASRALGVKVVNPGAVSAFKFNQRLLDLDERHKHYGVTPRQVLLTLARAVHDLGVPQPLHVHGCNLGVAGSGESTLKTIAAAEGLPMHLTHVQFHAYGKEGERGFSSKAASIAEAVNRNRNISMDVGQIMFGQTVTASGDVMHQYRGRGHAHPAKWVGMDIDCQGGCGVMPFRYRERNFVHALQWAIGLELFLMVEDPWRIFLTTDHPNGAPFIMYPHLIRLLMDRSFRNDMLKTLHPAAAAMSSLASLKREYTLYEIATLTRAAPARLLGLQQLGHLGAGACGDVVVYTPHDDRARMFARPDYVFKNGELVARNGRLVKSVAGKTHALAPDYDRGGQRAVREYYADYQGMSMEHAVVRDSDFGEGGAGECVVHGCKPRRDGRQA